MFIPRSKCEDYHKNVIFCPCLSERPQKGGLILLYLGTNQGPVRPEPGPMRAGPTQSVLPAIRLILTELSPHNVHTTNTQNTTQNV